MRIIGILLLVFCFGSNAEARHHPHRHAPGAKHLGIARHEPGLATVVVATGHRITVAAHLKERWAALVADFKEAGYVPRRIGCFATGGHVAHSRHYAGAACDFDQRGWGLTVPFMYSAKANALIKKHGFRNGCLFSDCGHVDDGLPGRGRRGGHGRPFIQPDRYWPFDFFGSDWSRIRPRHRQALYYPRRHMRCYQCE